jgi:GAF domain-containing protein
MARKKAGEKKALDQGKRIMSVQADRDSIAVGEINIDGDVTGTVMIGNGYTAEQVAQLLNQITDKYQRKPFDGRCPYKGLEVFEEEDAHFFFGRETLVNELVNRLNGSRIMFITGPSGSGKSSLVRAGLIPALKQGAISSLRSELWFYETFQPGRDPIEALSMAFSRLKSPELATYFRKHVHERGILNECAKSVLSGRKNQRLVLFIDQFEEVFTQVSKEHAEALITLIADAASLEHGCVIFLFAMRSDFVSNCAAYLQLNALLNQQFIQVGAMRPDELVSAIVQPALCVNLHVAPELIVQIINDMQGEPGALPLMQFALKDLFDSQQEKGGFIALSLEDYLQHGGIQKSLERHADNSFADLSEDEQQLARSIFSGLIEIGRGTQDTRRTALFEELIPAKTNPENIRAVIQKLADARLIITDEKAGRNMVTIAHEKLIDAWPWLKRLVNENRDAIALQNEIVSDAKEWDDHQRDPSYLYTGVRLANAREQLEANKLILSDLARIFVDTGIEIELTKLQFNFSLRELSDVLADSRDLPTLMENIVEKVSEVLHADAASLYLADESGTILHIQAATGYKAPLVTKAVDYKWGQGMTGRIAADKKPILANSLERLRDLGGNGASDAFDYIHMQVLQPQSFYGLPLIVRDEFGAEKVIGVLQVESTHNDFFSSESVLLIVMMANVIAAVVYNTQQSEKRLRDFSINLRELSDVLVGSQDMKSLMDNIVKKIADVLHVDAASLYLADESGTELVIQAAAGYQEPLVRERAKYKWGQGVTGRIAATKRPVLAQSLQELRMLAGATKGAYDSLHAQHRQPQSFYGLPLVVGDKSQAIGVLKIESVEKMFFSSEDVLLIGMMANVIATVVYNVQQGEKRIGNILEGLDS